MIKEFSFFHGAVFAKLIHDLGKPFKIQPFNDSENSAYVIDNALGLYIKYSKKRLTPWSFTFSKKHQDSIQQLKNLYGEVIVALVCNDDGIVGLSFSELKSILDHQHEEIEWIRVERSKRSMYQVTGSDGGLDFKVGRDDYIIKIQSAIDHKKPNLSSDSIVNKLRKGISFFSS